ncbi:MAG: uroporphyrinogen decarboxylase family protein [Lentisphaeria bacterium]|nr:uroporphyrinogen decarboxylase family protein [Lentisphaeria bacterium]
MAKSPASHQSENNTAVSSDPIFDSYMGRGPKQVVHWEHWSNPDAETYLTGINYFDHPKQCREKMRELYPELRLGIPKTDDPIPHIEDQEDKGWGRWGGRFRDNWQQHDASHRFKSLDDMLKFSPLKQADFTGWNVVVDGDFSSEDIIYERFRKNYPAEWGDTAPAGRPACVYFYNTMFMWPMLTFGYENFLMLCLEPAFERIMDEFAEINRRVFRAFARLPVNFAVCHDDIVLTSGPVVSPAWMNKYIFPRYEEYWRILKDAGKEVLFMVDGNVDAFADDVMACGARGIISEPYTDYKAIARKYENCFIAGEGDNRVLMRNNPAEIRKMVESMAETAKMSAGYMMCVGNHIPFNVPGEAIKRYIELSRELAVR